MFAKRLKLLRSRRDISQSALSKQLGVSQQTVGSWEVGRTSPDKDMLTTIANYFNVSTDYLLGNTDVEKPSPAPQSSTDPVKCWLRKVCAGNEKALAALDHIQITSTGEVKLDGADIASEAVLQHTIKSLIAALENAKPGENGNINADWKPGK